MPYSFSEKLSRPSDTACRIDVAGSVTIIRWQRKVPTDASATPPRNVSDTSGCSRSSHPTTAPTTVASTTTRVRRVRMVITSDLGAPLEHDPEPLHPPVERLPRQPHLGRRLRDDAARLQQRLLDGRALRVGGGRRTVGRL